MRQLGMTDNSPLLTPTQRDLLKDLAAADDVDRRELSRLRARVRSIIVDFSFLLAGLPPEERRKIFSDLDKYRAFVERKWDKSPVTADEELFGRVKRAADEPDAVEEEGGMFHNGVIATLGFLYAGVDDTPTFEAMLEYAIRESRLVDGRIAVDVEVTIDMEREERRDELVERLKAGDIDPEAEESLLKSDPGALFEAFADDDE